MNSAPRSPPYVSRGSRASVAGKYQYLALFGNRFHREDERTLLLLLLTPRPQKPQAFILRGEGVQNGRVMENDFENRPARSLVPTRDRNIRIRRRLLYYAHNNIIIYRPKNITAAAALSKTLCTISTLWFFFFFFITSIGGLR